MIKIKNVGVRRLLILLISVLIMLYIGGQIFTSNRERIKTETVVYTKAAESIKTHGYVVRKETPIKYDSKNVISYVLNDGDSVSGGGTIGYLFKNSEDAKAQKEIEYLNMEIESLKSIDRESVQMSINPTVLDKQIKQTMKQLKIDINSEDLYKARETTEDISYLLNQRQSILSKEMDFVGKIEQDKARIKELETKVSKSVGSVKSPNAGFFISKIDGYENFFDYDNILNISLDTIKKGLPDVNIDDQDIAGKTVNGLNWYIACEVLADDALKLKKDEEVLVAFPFSTSDLVPAKVVTINQKDIYNDAAVVLQFNYMREELSNIRYEEIRIDSDTCSGLRVDKRAIHINTVKKSSLDSSGNEVEESRDVQGVYVLYGNQLKFKEIAPIHAYSDFVLCDSNQESVNLFTGETIKLYDEVVVEGTNLYDGKPFK